MKTTIEAELPDAICEAITITNQLKKTENHQKQTTKNKTTLITIQTKKMLLLIKERSQEPREKITTVQPLHS